MKKLLFMFIAVLPFALLTGCSGSDNSLNNNTTITSFTFLDIPVMGIVNENNYSISVVVPFGTDITALTAIVEHSGYSISPEISFEQDFTNPVIYTVTAEDGTEQSYLVSVSVATDGINYSLINGDTEYEASKGSTSSKSIIIIPDYHEGKKITSIGLFSESDYLTGITIPVGVTSITSDWAFEDNPLLTDITIPDGVTFIGYGAFSGCTSLQGISIPAGITFIGDSFFQDCTSLKDLYMEPTAAPGLGTTYVFRNVIGCTLHIKSGATGYDIEPWTDTEIFSSIVEDL